MSDSVRPPRRQSTRLLCPWDSPGKNTGVGCYFLLQNICSINIICNIEKKKSVSHVPTLWDTVDCSLPDFSVHGIVQARILEWVAIPFSRGSFQTRDQTQVSCIAGKSNRLSHQGSPLFATYVLM